MLPKKNRLGKNNFPRGGRGRAFAFGSVRVFPGAAKVAVVVSKKVSSKAVARNALRRKVYAACAPILKEGALRFAVVVYPDMRARAAGLHALTAALRAAILPRG